MDAVEDHFGKRGLIILSGYRTPHFNGQVPGSARYSPHMPGWAADIKVPGCSSAKVARYAVKLRAVADKENILSVAAFSPLCTAATFSFGQSFLSSRRKLVLSTRLSKRPMGR